MIVECFLDDLWMIDDDDSNLRSTLDLMSRHHKFLAYQKERQYDVVLKFSSRSWPPGKLPRPPKNQRLIIPCWINTMYIR